MYNSYDYWEGTTNFISLGPIWLNSKDKISAIVDPPYGAVNCFVHGKEF
jgi:hypothetical protein